MKNTGKILMILVGFFGLLFLFWAGSDLFKAKLSKKPPPREASTATKSP